MRHALSTMGSGAPQPPGRTPRSAGLRASCTTRPQAPLRCPGGETLLAPGASPRRPVRSEASEAPGRAPAREAGK
jgi:hypothetical protein